MVRNLSCDTSIYGTAFLSKSQKYKHTNAQTQPIITNTKTKAGYWKWSRIHNVLVVYWQRWTCCSPRYDHQSTNDDEATVLPPPFSSGKLEFLSLMVGWRPTEYKKYRRDYYELLTGMRNVFNGLLSVWKSFSFQLAVPLQPSSYNRLFGEREE